MFQFKINRKHIDRDLYVLIYNSYFRVYDKTNLKILNSSSLWNYCYFKHHTKYDRKVYFICG